MADLALSLLQRAGRLRTERGTWDSHWQSVRDVTIPTVGGFTVLGSPGAKDRYAVLNSAGETIAERLAAALDGMMTNPAVKWVDLEPLEDAAATSDDQAALWLERASDVMLAVFNTPSSGFRGAMLEVYLDLVCFGTACLFAVDRPGKLPLFRARPLQQVHVCESADGRVDTVFVRIEMPARQVAREWPDSAGWPKVKAALDRGGDECLTVWHCCLPSDEKVDYLAGVSKKPFASVWLLEQEKRVLASGGYDEFPYMVPRWQKRAGEAYGRGPGMKALPDLQMLQRMMRTTIVAAETAILPAYMVPDDGVAGPIDTRSGRGIVVRSDLMMSGHDPIRPLQRGANPALGVEMMDYVLQHIRQAFLWDLLTVMQDPKMTATQILQLVEETNRVLGPVAGRLESELLAPLVERTFAILARGGAFLWEDLPPPASLGGKTIRARFQSPMARAQRLSEVNGVVRTMEIVAPMADRDPSVMDNFDADRIARHVADVNGLPKALMRPADAVEAMRSERLAAAEQTQQIEQASKGAGGAARLISALDKAGVGQNAGMPA